LLKKKKKKKGESSAAFLSVQKDINTTTKYPAKYHVTDNAVAARSSNDKEVYGIQQNVTKSATYSNPLTVFNLFGRSKVGRK